MELLQLFSSTTAQRKRLDSVMADEKDDAGTDAPRSDEKVADKVREELTRKAEKALADRRFDTRREGT